MKVKTLYKAIDHKQSQYQSPSIGQNKNLKNAPKRRTNLSRIDEMRIAHANLVKVNNVRAIDATNDKTCAKNPEAVLEEWVSSTNNIKERASRRDVANTIIAAGVTLTKGMLKVSASLVLSGSDVRSLPNNMFITGDMNIENCRNLYSTPRGLKVTGSVWSGGCDNLGSVASGTEVGENFILCGNKNLINVGKKLTIGKSLDVNSCPALKSIEGPIAIGENLYAGRCPNLESVPSSKKISIGGSLFLVQSMTGLKNSQSLKDLIIEKLKSVCTVSLKGVDLPLEIKNVIHDDQQCVAKVLL